MLFADFFLEPNWKYVGTGELTRSLLLATVEKQRVLPSFLETNNSSTRQQESHRKAKSIGRDAIAGRAPAQKVRPSTATLKAPKKTK